MSGTTDELGGKLDEVKDTATENAKPHEGFLDKMKEHVEDAVDRVKDAFDGHNDNNPKPA